ncbi:MAG: twin-arginine translocase TatA/TatE family subunit [bacterium]|nr:twin-arginine translocase TatA/TatE family subunit [bacterium]
MFGISFPELLVVLVLVLLVFGPEKLPEVARKFGKIMGDFKKNSDSIRREFYNSVYTPANDVRNQISRELKGVRSEAQKITSDSDNNKKDLENESKKKTEVEKNPITHE